MNTLSVFLGAYRYEFRMQIRRFALWIVFGLFCLGILGIGSRVIGVNNVLFHLSRYPIRVVVVLWMNVINTILLVGAGILLADRFVRDQRTHTDEVLITTPGSLFARLFGKYLGSTIATLVPILLFCILGLGFILVQTGDFQALSLGLAAFLTVILPGMLFVGAFSIALPSIIWVPLYQFLFIGYWFWGNIYQPKGIPTLSGTLLTPAGGYMSLGFFGSTLFPVAHATVLQGVESLLLLLVLAVLAMVGLWGISRWRYVRS